MRSIPTFVADVWQLAKPYFTESEDRRSARLLLATVVLMRLVLVALEVMLSFWNSAFFTSLQEKDWDSFIRLLLTWKLTATGNIMPGFCWIAAGYITIAVYRGYLTQWLQIRWRRWMTQRFLGAWLGDKVYYHISLIPPAKGRPGVGVENPDQRIAEDLRAFIGDDIGGTRGVLSFGVDLVSTCVSLVSFVVILWQLSGPLVVWGLDIPGYMVWVALLYAALGTVATHRLGRPLTRLNFARQRVEADFRFALARLRENVEGVALLDGEEAERHDLMARFEALAGNWWLLMQRYKLLTALTSGYGQVASVFPIVVAAPRYFAGLVPLGVLVQTAGAFGSVQGALSWLVDTYADLASFRATVERLTGFQRSIEEARAMAGRGLRSSPGPGPGYDLGSAIIALPGGQEILRQPDLPLKQGDTLLLTGRSGCGKSTLLRAIAGIWPFGTGRVVRPPGRVMFLPQRPYIPLGSLRRAVSYPAPAELHPREAVADALRSAGLGMLLPHLDEHDHWHLRLSPGEQQRLAIARALLSRPDWLFLDEATGSLDGDSADELYRTLRERLPNATIVSVAHQAAVARFHQRRALLRRGMDGVGVLSEAAISAHA